jgi:SPX domain protein involved in polyphosphate accumulation
MPVVGGRRFRHEQKYVMPLTDAEGFFEDIMPFCDYDKHAGETKSYEIASIYYDTDDLRFYYDREESIGYRRKIRLRSYNTAHEATALFLEIKEKHKHFVHKKRIYLKSLDLLKRSSPDMELPLGAVIEELEDTAEAREIEYLHKRLHLYPVVLIRYHRKAAIPKFEDDMRITLDTNITTGGDSLPVFDPKTEQSIIAPGYGVLEIKSNQSVPFWLQSILIRHNMAQCRYSKYCLGVDILYGSGPHKNFIPCQSEDPFFPDEKEGSRGTDQLNPAEVGASSPVEGAPSPDRVSQNG